MDGIEYENQHQVCPDCGSKSIESTTIGYIVPNGDYTNHKDNNAARCGCGWKGVVHNLLPFTPLTIVRGEE